MPPPESIAVTISPPAPHPGSVRRAVDLLCSAQRPAIIAGGGVRRSGVAAQQSLFVLAEVLDAPVVCTPGGNTAFPYDHPLSLGGWIEDRFVTEVFDDADVLLAVGTSLGEISSNYYTLQPRGRVIQIDAEPQVLGSNYPGLGIRADAESALDTFVSAIQRGQKPTESSWHGLTSLELVQKVRDQITSHLGQQPLEHEQSIMQAIREAVPDDAHTFWDMTIAGYWTWNMWDAKQGAFHSAQGAGGIGFAFPAALGVTIGAQQRVLAVSGDGSAMYSIAEQATVRQHDIPVTWFIIDDGGYGILRKYMHDAFGQTFGTELTRPDFVTLARAFGIDATATTPESLADDLRAAWDADGPNTLVLATTMTMWEPTHR